MYNKIVKVKPIPIDPKNLSSKLSDLKLSPNWKTIPPLESKDSNIKIGHKLVRETIKFKNFEITWAFLNQLAMRCHLWGHHPTISTTYNKVDLQLFNHDLNMITDIDLKLASKIESYINLYNQASQEIKKE
ncbi:4a-hydroxytetrahydrobiopterin dehydratase NDAI_0B01620 [Naumovozyma dairenensis CBS 421]|uniref:4a-hydroxytetrahydrobiopterin dehydratase n=1 Tax=Naumovozyma dairenensis (strain ATCC 10597 / BCRC 20456 / CBS 421 / NBRC 0211 / NRRL Y-12639) TaxID=1071378 RepID=G0W5Y5_NAUDC|nr:hypothetical protein NDAI_0B01620 [Naumovozyma dairenensis CBS 421]CCD23196.1 hypothetical protein NDAI_0B01620 [Naumovozyma dairenensis CBS 421]